MNVKHLTTHETREFRRIFGREVRKYWHPVLGFDILTFESDMNLDSPTLSMAEVIRGRFGVEGESLIRSLLKPFHSEESEENDGDL